MITRGAFVVPSVLQCLGFNVSLCGLTLVLITEAASSTGQRSSHGVVQAQPQAQTPPATTDLKDTNTKIIAFIIINILLFLVIMILLISLISTKNNAIRRLPVPSYSVTVKQVPLVTQDYFFRHSHQPGSWVGWARCTRGRGGTGGGAGVGGRAWAGRWARLGRGSIGSRRTGGSYKGCGHAGGWC